MKRKVVALTGVIGSGKSAVAGILREMGYKTVDCDLLAKQVATSPDVIENVEQLLGSKSVVKGQLDRKYIREVVFADENLLSKYQQIFFDGVKTLLAQNLADLQQEKAVFVEIPVLDAFDFHFDEVWRIESSEQACVSRVTARDGVSADSVHATLARQKTYESTRVIHNNGNFYDLTEAVKVALTKSQLV